MAGGTTREIGRFVARSEDGEYEATIVVLQKFIDASTLSNRSAPPIPGLKEVRTADGFACDYLDENTFKVVNDPFHPGMIVRRVSAAD